LDSRVASAISQKRHPTGTRRSALQAGHVAEFRQDIIDPTTSRPGPWAGLLAESVRTLARIFLACSGWRIQGDWPDIPKAVLIAAPHTSNWDGVYTIACFGYFRKKVSWMGKKSLTTGPFGGLITWLGCVPIDRSARHDVVRSMSDAMIASKQMILLVPPEGTRSLVGAWKTGFYHIAVQANVPLLLAVMDYGTRTIRLAAVAYPSGDYTADLPQIQAHYIHALGKHREKSTTAP
jgi:1-acyl-sn-glycerol-3-phosphate acyltransferase